MNRNGKIPPGARLRMKDLVRETGLPRETIHFYLLEGLLPPAEKTGHNTALYGRQHLQRLREIRDLQAKQFLPLKAIKAIYDSKAGARFTPDQTRLIRDIRTQLGTWQQQPAKSSLSVASAATRSGVPVAEIRDLARSGVITLQGRGSSATVPADDLALIEAWGDFRRIGVGPERGFIPGHMGMFDEAVEQLVRREIALFTERFTGVPGADAAETVEKAVRIANRLLVALHWKKMREFFLRYRASGARSAPEAIGPTATPRRRTRTRARTRAISGTSNG